MRQTDIIWIMEDRAGARVVALILDEARTVAWANQARICKTGPVLEVKTYTKQEEIYVGIDVAKARVDVATRPGSEGGVYREGAVGQCRGLHSQALLAASRATTLTTPPTPPTPSTSLSSATGWPRVRRRNRSRSDGHLLACWPPVESHVLTVTEGLFSGRPSRII